MFNLKELISNAIFLIDKAENLIELNNIRIAYLGKKGIITSKINLLYKLSQKERKTVGKSLNDAKYQIQNRLNFRKVELEKIMLNISLSEEIIDISLPGRHVDIGSLHPITSTIDRLEKFFCSIGFTIATGLEIEEKYYNFDALNIPEHHPARTNQDTFWFDKTRLLRTQISSMQIRTMKHCNPPIRIISSGRVYRNDYDAVHTPMFHQMEGFVVDKFINFSNLKALIYNCMKNFFEEDIQINFRPSYFPFTEPSAEVDIKNKNGKWVEVLGCGMIHPNVLDNVGIQSEKYSGLAFGIGIERLTMLRFGITDVRRFFENDLRFLQQFKQG